MPEVWLISAIVLSGYCAYWGTLRLTSYATDVFLLSVTLAALLSSLKLWVKPFAALGAGVLADKLGVTQVIVTLFIILLLGFLSFAFLPGTTGWIPVMVLNLILVSMAVFGLRGIYFALVHESGVPFEVTGVAIGVISMIGLSPDIFTRWRCNMTDILEQEHIRGQKAISTSFYVSVAYAAWGLSPHVL